MNYLLDSHYLLWAIADSKKISGKIKDIIVQPENKIIVSALSFWEISLKTALKEIYIRRIKSDRINLYQSPAHFLSFLSHILKAAWQTLP